MLQSGEAIQFSAQFSVTFTDQHILPREFLEVLSGVNVHPSQQSQNIERSPASITDVMLSACKLELTQQQMRHYTLIMQ